MISQMTDDVRNALKHTKIHECEYNEENDTIRTLESYVSNCVLAYAKKQGADSSIVVIREGYAEVDASWLIQNMMGLITYTAEEGNISDHDVSNFMRDLVGLLDYKTEDVLKKQTLSKGEYYLYLLSVKNSDTPYITDSEGTVYKVAGIGFQQTLFGAVIRIQTQNTFLLGDSVYTIANTQMVGGTKFVTASLPFVQADNDIIRARAKVSRDIIDNYEAVQYQSYEGIAYTPGFMGTVVEHYIDNERVIVDSQALKRTNYSHLQELLGMAYGRIDDESGHTTIPEFEERSDVELSTLIDGLVFFNLTSKEWLLGVHERTHNVDFRSDAFDKLILSDTKKDMIKAISTEHDVENTDIVDGKGSNAIFLLHGVPGTGKTLTAEAVSEYLKKPLYKVSLGELGTNVQRLEKSLKEILILCERWDAVMLIDEADVFLEKRDIDNLERNAMVAVFLRMLEYYSGILFLTTNRARQFDIAFVSRITLAIHYERPDMNRLWTMLLENSSFAFEENDIDELVKYNVNGRQAKSAINTAKAIAAYKHKTPSIAMVEETLNETVKFQEYIGE